MEYVSEENKQIVFQLREKLLKCSQAASAAIDKHNKVRNGRLTHAFLDANKSRFEFGDDAN